MKTITICSSANFYEQVVLLKRELEAMGYEVLMPRTARKMEESGDYDGAHYKTWFDNANDYDKKAELMRAHFNEVAKGDAVLVINNKKRDAADYIGGNVLMEMSLAFYLQKPIYLFNEIPQESAFLEEVIGLGSVPLHGDLTALAQLFPA